jgi:hypothetical protein
MPDRSRRCAGALRKIIGLWTVVMIGATLPGCTSIGNHHAGAPTGSTASGPTVLAQESLPPLAPRMTASDKAMPATETSVQELSDGIDQALARTGDRAPATHLTIKPAAGNQLQVRWVAGLVWPDPGARLRVRQHVLTILSLVQHSRVHYGTVLLMATGPTFAPGSTTKHTTSIVVRAKYSHDLVLRTDWQTVSPDAVLGMCDDKPAVVAPGYR